MYHLYPIKKKQFSLLYTDNNCFFRFNSQLAEWANKRTNKAGDMTETAAAPAAATAAGILPPQDQRKYYGNYGERQNLRTFFSLYVRHILTERLGQKYT